MDCVPSAGPANEDNCRFAISIRPAHLMRRPGGLRSISGTVDSILLQGGLRLRHPLRSSPYSRSKAFLQPAFPRLLFHAFPHQTFAHLSPIRARLPPSRVCSCRHRCSCSKTLAARAGSRDPTFMSSEVVIQDPESLEKKKAAIRNAGTGKLQVIADFDGTLTRYWIDGCRGQSSHGLLQQANPEYDAKRQALYEYYHPLEYSPTIPIEEKTKLMEEWWEKTHGLLIEGGLTYDAIEKSVAGARIAFRDGVVELFEFLEEKGVPILIFSAGLADIIEEVFRQKIHRSFKNVKIVSNRMVFDENGHLIAFKGKTIHVLNKNEHALDMTAPIHDRLGDPNGLDSDIILVKNRTSVLLLGDHIGDLGMSDGVNYENRISVGFLNDNIEESLKNHSEAFDVVYLKDASMKGVVELVSHLCSPD